MAEHNRYFAGLDLGGTFLKIALGDAKGALLVKDKLPSRADESDDKVFDVIFKAIEILQVAAAKRNGRLAAIGLGSPGAIDFEKGRLVGKTPNIVAWQNTDIRGRLLSKYDIPVWVDNDANIMALAESRKGAAMGCKNVIFATLGTGIGGGILIKGEIYRGAHFAGAEIGHMMIVHDGIPCNCGGRGCFEQYAAAPAIVREYLSRMKAAQKTVSEKITTKIIFDMAANGDSMANEAIDLAISYLGTGFAGLVNIFNPEMIVIGGGVADAGEPFVQRIHKAIKMKAMKPALKGLRVKRAALGNDAGVVGAILLAREMLQKST